tara:strand:- start:2925 stop:3254 length:330 start_codon:yes stop_codon:yes gene_type:complete
MSDIQIPDVLDGIIYLTDIDKSQIRDGKKGKWVPIRVKATPNNEYNDCMVTLRLPKEAREAGHKDPIIGNVSVPDWLKEQMANGSGAAATVSNDTQVQAGGASDGDLPF